MEPVRRSLIHDIDDVALPAGTFTVHVINRLGLTHYANNRNVQPVVQGITTLIDESEQGKILVHGRAGGQAVAALGLEAPVEIGRGRTAEGIAVYRLRADQLFISVPPGREAVTYAALVAAETDERVTVTDVTHGRAQLRLVGPASADLLSRVCGLDLSPDRVPDHSAHQTSVAKTTQLLIRSDWQSGLSYALVGARSLGEYLWRSLLAANNDPGALSVRRAAPPPPAA